MLALKYIKNSRRNNSDAAVAKTWKISLPENVNGNIIKEQKQIDICLFFLSISKGY